MADAPTQLMVPKTTLPDCAVGETLKIVGEDGENFIMETVYEEQEEAPAEGSGELPEAVKAVMGRA